MKPHIHNPCIRCGKARIVTKTWKEGNITYSTSVCPDSECQKIVDAELKKKSDHYQKMQKLSHRKPIKKKKGV